jgi:hypothetical protein
VLFTGLLSRGVIHQLGSEKHYSDEQWADFVRSLTAPAEHLTMQSHLDAGCDSCRQIVHFLTMVEKTATTDSTYTVPQALVEQATLLFQPREAASNWTDRLLEMPLTLVWQQQQDWAPQGVRSAGVEGNRIMYRAGDYSLDLNLETAPGEPGEIVGQIVNDREVAQSLENLLVQVISGGKAVGETTTNRFGEFIITIPQQGKAVLRFALPHVGQRIDVPVNGLERK